MGELTRVGPRTALRIVALLVLLELLSVISLWTLSPLSSASESTFALMLAVDLVAFAMISYTYRVSRWGEVPGRVPLIAGCCFALLLLFAGLLA
jgi:hypothetical protein